MQFLRLPSINLDEVMWENNIPFSNKVTYLGHHEVRKKSSLSNYLKLELPFFLTLTWQRLLVSFSLWQSVKSPNLHHELVLVFLSLKLSFGAFWYLCFQVHESLQRIRERKLVNFIEWGPASIQVIWMSSHLLS